MKLLLGGSPCTHWSIAQTKNRETKPEGLGWELFLNYLIALEKYQPRYFLYENNKSMSSDIRAQITAELGVEPILINSALVSAQNRQRLYWTNIPGVGQPEDKGILLQDILESGVVWREKGYTIKANYTNVGAVNGVDGGHFPAPMAAEPVRIGTIESDAKNADFDSQQYRVYSSDGKSVTICGQGGGVGAKTGLYAVPIEAEPVNVTADGKAHTIRASCYKDGIRNMVGNTIDKKTCVAIRVGDMPNAEGEIKGGQAHRVYDADGKAVTLTARPNGGGVDGPLYAVTADGHQSHLVAEGVPAMRVPEVTKQGYCEVLPGECVDLAMEHSKTRRGRRMKEKSNCITTDCAFYEYCGTMDKPVYQVENGYIVINGKQYPIKLRDGFYIIRKLTVRECMRLQTVPEEYIFPVSDTQAYKMLGNGWTVDVIAHILSYAPGISSIPLEVLSMYDGMSCGRLALNKLGAHVRRYYATEIDKYAVKTTQANFPDTVQLGDAFRVREADWRLEGRRRTAEDRPVQLEINFAGRQLWK